MAVLVDVYHTHLITSLTTSHYFLGLNTATGPYPLLLGDTVTPPCTLYGKTPYQSSKVGVLKVLQRKEAFSDPHDVDFGSGRASELG